MTYMETIGLSFVIIINILIALAGAAVIAYIVYRCFPRRIRCKITRWIKNL